MLIRHATPTANPERYTIHNIQPKSAHLRDGERIGRRRKRSDLARRDGEQQGRAHELGPHAAIATLVSSWAGHIGGFCCIAVCVFYCLNMQGKLSPTRSNALMSKARVRAQL